MTASDPTCEAQPITNADARASAASRARPRIETVEALRGIAAFYIVLHHYGHELLSIDHPRLAQLFVFGQAAVMVFFVLSGFVIYYSSFGRDPHTRFRDYFVRRFRRIYPPFTAALALSYVCACIRRQAILPLHGRELLGNLFMLQDSMKQGNWFDPYYGNSPLWSLSYEWFFYMAFFALSVALRGRENAQKYVVAGLGLGAGLVYGVLPNQISLFLMYFILWWSGVELAREYLATGAITIVRQAPSVALISVLCLPWAATVLEAHRAGRTLSVYEHPLIELRHFLTTLGFLVMGLVWNRIRFRGLRALTGWGAALAPVSYALYVVHYPIVELLTRYHFTPWITLDFLLWGLPLILGVSYLLEVRLQPKINAWLPAGAERRRAGSASRA